MEGRKCIWPSCETRALFNYKGTTYGMYCVKHKDLGMIDIVSSKCPCGKRMYFGFPYDKRPSACVNCKLDGMIDIKNPKCPCGTRMSFGSPRDKRPSACVNCKLDGMIDIVSSKCPCGKNMVFGFPRDKRPSACFNCKLDGMIDIKHPKCPCGKRMVFGFPRDKLPSACVNCKLDGMIDIVSSKCPCGTRMSFGFPHDKRPSACVNCKLDGMIDIVNPKCPSCSLFIVSKQGSLCSYCNPNARHRTKEFIVKNFLDEHKISYVYNKSTGVCGNFRPDFLIDCSTHLIVVEVDEGQHKQYDSECENFRMVNIQQSLGLYAIFLRYNPDKYNGPNVSTEKRLNALLERITFYQDRPQDKSMDVEYLFYDAK